MSNSDLFLRFGNGWIQKFFCPSEIIEKEIGHSKNFQSTF